jgi:hypothetical protein
MRNFSSITVKALREMLEGEDDDALVAFACDYGDYHHTEQALAIKGELEEASLVESAYSHSGFAVADADDEDEEEAEEVEGPKVLVLR